jgi:hypothetical protein
VSSRAHGQLLAEVSQPTPMPTPVTEAQQRMTEVGS